MSDNLNEFLSENKPGGDDESGGSLRVKLERANALIKQLGDENATLKSAHVEQTVKATWDELKVPAAIRGFYTGEKTSDAITKWWSESKGFFNVEAGETTEQPQQETAEQAAVREAHASFQQATAVGNDLPNSTADALSAEANRIKGLKGDAYEAAKTAFYDQLGFERY